MGPDGRARAARRGRAARGGRGRCGRPRSRRSRCACCSRFLHPEHEQAVGEALREALARRARVAVVRGAARVPRVRALLDDRGRRLPRAAARRLPASGWRRAPRTRACPTPLVMQSSGGVVEIGDAAQAAAGCVLSGPAGGVVGAAYVGAGERLRRRADLRHGRHEHRRGAGARRRGRRPPPSRWWPACRSSCRWSTSTRSAPAAARSRGPTRAARCASGRTRRAPIPGPAAYGRGGEEPTVTDANLFLGYLARRRRAGRRGRAATASRAEAALERARRVGSGSTRSRRALGVVRVANAEMSAGAAGDLGRARPRPARVRARRLRRRRRHARVRAGRGARACATVLVPRAGRRAERARAGDLRHAARLRRARCSARSTSSTRDAWSALRRARGARRARTSTSPTLRRRADLRYRRQAFELTVDADDLGDARRALPRRARARYGYRMDERAGGARQRPRSSPPCRSRSRSCPRTSRRTATAARRRRGGASFDGDVERGRRRARRAALWAAARAVEGPAIVEFAEATCVVRPGLGGRGRRRRHARAGAVVSDDGGSTPSRCRCSPARWPASPRRWARCWSAAPTRRTSRSAATARRRCSTREGRMVAQAEHIPVHLGAMPESVAAVMERDPRPGRRVHPQRPVPRRHPPARHHARVADRARRRGRSASPSRARTTRTSAA